MPKAKVHPVLEIYECLKRDFKNDAISPNVTNAIRQLYIESKNFLASFDKEKLRPDRTGKEYFSFLNESNKLSRAVNDDLYLSDDTLLDIFFENLQCNRVTMQNAAEITKVCYTIAINFCCSIDMLKNGDQKTPGTFFEYYMGHLFAKQFNIPPTNRLEVLNLDMRASLPTDLIFDLGKNRPKFHVPIKTSTRERVVQVWAHQRVLDGVYGTGRFLGLLSCLSETKLDHRTKVVTEICLPDQWRVYQMFVSQLKRV